MFHSRFRFTLAIADEAGFPVHREEVQDFLPLYEDLLFRAVLAGVVPNDGSLPPASLSPVFEPSGGTKVMGLLASLPSQERRYGLGLLAARVQEVLVERKLQEDPETAKARFTWRVEAHELAHGAQPRRLRSSRRRQPYPLVRDRLVFAGAGGTHEELVSLFVRRGVLESLREEAARLDVERAHVLVGHLVQEGPGAAAAVVTGDSPVEIGAGASRERCEFTPELFLRIRREVGNRTDGAVLLGWAHNHPPPACLATCPQSAPTCSLLFFSIPQDHEVHRAAFAAPYMVALVSGKDSGRRADEPGVRAFGWQDGRIAERRFRVFE